MKGKPSAWFAFFLNISPHLSVKGGLHYPLPFLILFFSNKLDGIICSLIAYAPCGADYARYVQDVGIDKAREAEIDPAFSHGNKTMLVLFIQSMAEHELG